MCPACRCRGRELLQRGTERHRQPMARKGIFFPLKDAALRDDVHALGNLVGEVIKEQCGQTLFDAVEGDRHAATAPRTARPSPAVQLLARSRCRTPATAGGLIRAFSPWLHIVT